MRSPPPTSRPERLQASLDFSSREGLARYVALQPHYNLVSRDTYEGALQDVAAGAGLAAVPYFALASGFLTGKYRPGTTVDSARAAGAGAHLEHRARPRVLAALDEVAEAHGAEHRHHRPRLARRPADRRRADRLRPHVDQLPALLAVADLTLTEEELNR